MELYSRSKSENLKLFFNYSLVELLDWVLPLVPLVFSAPFVVLLQKIWLFYKTSERHHKWDIYIP